MDQIIVIAGDKSKYEADFKKYGFYVTWSSFDLKEVIKIRDRSNIILVCAVDEDYETLKKLGFYLRDICIEEEKTVYLYGRKEKVEIIKELVPSMYIKLVVLYHVAFSTVPGEILKHEFMPVRNKPTFLIIDNDTEYVGKLRLYLEPYFQILVSRFDFEEAGMLLLKSDIVLISMDATFTLREFMSFFKAVMTKKHSPLFHFFYLASSNSERYRMNAGSENESISFSKEMEVSRVAGYFAKSFGKGEQ
ncbi:MAG: hypothetical protein IJP84_10095 [Lachnospiraceae bacterium]|nr:hypothetical protein [Lachnospiraceae bacterium]